MKQRKLIAVIAMILVLVLCAGVLAACGPNGPDGPGNGVNDGPDGPSGPQGFQGVSNTEIKHVDNLLYDDSKTYTYLDSFSTSPSTWNPHTYRTTDDSYVADFTTAGLYEFYFNEDKTGYEIWPVMADGAPVDVTEELKAESKWEIPAEATKGYAYKIGLNPYAAWDDGTPINATTYVESMKRLLNPEYLNYRASEYYTGDLQIFGAKDFNKQGAPVVEDYLDYADYPGTEGDDAVLPYKGEDGYYYVDVDGTTYPVVVSLGDVCAFFGDGGLEEYGDYYIDYLGDYYLAIKNLQDRYGVVYVNDDVIDNLITIAYIFNDPKPADWVEFCHVITGIGGAYNWDNVGIYASGEYEITIVLNKSLTGFYLLYNLTGNWIVNVELYDACLTESNGIWNNTYCTNVETAASTGPYKLTTYDDGKLMVFTRNDSWVGYKDERFAGLYQASQIRSECVQEASTRKQKFLRGELDAYGLQAADYSEYRMSSRFHASPGTTIFFLVLVGDEGMLSRAQATLTNVNKTILANDKFREALSVSFDKKHFAATISPSRQGAFSVIGSQDIWNPLTGESYRSTLPAQEALVDYYGFEKQEDGTWKLPTSDSVFTLEDALDAITGYNPDLAKSLFLEAYEEWLAAGKISATDKIEIEYALSADSTFMTQTIDYLNNQLNTILAGTVLEGRVAFVKSAPLGDDWSTALRNGQSQTCLCGWSGGMLNPFGTMLYYTDPDKDPYAESWWATETEKATMVLTIDGVETTVTMTISDWALCLNGDQKTSDEGDSFNFGFEQVADDVRLQILAGLEKAILATNYYIPMLQDGSGFLLSHKVDYVLGPDDYNAVLGRGGLAYMHFNYTDAEWAEYLASVGGKLTY